MNNSGNSRDAFLMRLIDILKKDWPRNSVKFKASSSTSKKRRPPPEVLVTQKVLTLCKRLSLEQIPNVDHLVSFVNFNKGTGDHVVILSCMSMMADEAVTKRVEVEMLSPAIGLQSFLRLVPDKPMQEGVVTMISQWFTGRSSLKEPTDEAAVAVTKAPIIHAKKPATKFLVASSRQQHLFIGSPKKSPSTLMFLPKKPIATAPKQQQQQEKNVLPPPLVTNSSSSEDDEDSTDYDKTLVETENETKKEKGIEFMGETLPPAPTVVVATDNPMQKEIDLLSDEMAEDKKKDKDKDNKDDEDDDENNESLI